jgi:8-oxo-dGTP pyrophosphatase MutT (NUDIX family)
MTTTRTLRQYRRLHALWLIFIVIPCSTAAFCFPSIVGTARAADIKPIKTRARETWFPSGFVALTSPHRDHPVRISSVGSATTLRQAKSTVSAEDMASPGVKKGSSRTTTTVASLAGSYLVRCGNSDTGARDCTTTTWTLTPLDDIATIDTGVYPSEGARAYAALYTSHDETAVSASDVMARSAGARASIAATVTIAATFSEQDRLQISASEQSDLTAVLGRVAAQMAIRQREEAQNYDMTITTTSTVILIDFTHEQSTATWSIGRHGMGQAERNDNIRRLFGELDPDQSEIVEMVDSTGQPLGCVPRKLVHRHNLLHRGIGMFVTDNRPVVCNNDYRQPALYCHRRTDTKKIFPSLYDMFVGGVSLVGEESTTTARREVAEELGLVAALEGLDHGTACGALSDKLLTCTVCTGHNRCVVDLFCYTMDTKSEHVSFQEEEVAWGSFVPYEIVQAAADRSILRLVEQNSWPGQYHPIQSSRKGMILADSLLEVDQGSFCDWTTFDFVPDGLLVWEAWLRYLENNQC